MTDYLPALPLQDLSDAERQCESIIAQVQSGTLDLKTAETMLKAVKTYSEIYVARLKNDPKVEAQKEYARGVARKAADSIDLKKAREMLLNRNFTPLEDAMGIIDIETQVTDAESRLKGIQKKNV